MTVLDAWEAFKIKKINDLHKPQDMVILHVWDMNPVWADLILQSIDSVSHEEFQPTMSILTGFIVDRENGQHWIP